MRNLFVILLFSFCFSFVASDASAGVGIGNFNIGGSNVAFEGGVRSKSGFVGIDGKGVTPTQPFGKLKTIEQICELDQNAFSLDPKKEIKFVSIAVPCFEKLISKIAKTSIEGMSGFLADGVSAALSLYLIFFGIKVSTGLTNEQRVKGEVVIHALKIAFITWLVFQSGITNVYEIVLTMFNGFIKMVMAPVEIGDCKVAAAQTQQIWNAMDCLFGKFIGWGAKNGAGQVTKGIPMLFGFVSSSVTAGFGGMLIAGIILMTLWALIMSFFRVALAYVLALLVIVLLFTIAPITLPMMLFTPTKQFFEQWWKMIVSMILQPVILFAFMAFALALMNEIVTGSGGLTGIVGGGGSEKGLTEYYAQMKSGYQNVGSRTQGDQSFIQQGFSMKFDNLELEKEMTLSLISMLMVAYLLLAFSKFASGMGHELSGLAFAPNLGKQMPGERR